MLQIWYQIAKNKIKNASEKQGKFTLLAYANL